MVRTRYWVEKICHQVFRDENCRKSQTDLQRQIPPKTNSDVLFILYEGDEEVWQRKFGWKAGFSKF
jgi:hypothetical protein